MMDHKEERDEWGGMGPTIWWWNVLNGENTCQWLREDKE
jgi:hypothetical protein